MTGVLSLPVEITSRAFEEFDVDELVELSHVCQYWRSIARDSFAFWRDIRCNARIRRDCKRFVDRLSQSKSVGLNISFIIFRRHGPERDATEAFAELVTNIHRVSTLWLDVSYEWDDYLRMAFKSAAPALRYLRLSWTTIGKNAAPLFNLPTDSFQNRCPDLDEIDFSNVRLPTSQCSALSSVTCASIRYNIRSGHPVVLNADVLRQFPSINRLVTIDCMIRPGELLDPIPSGLEDLTVAGGRAEIVIHAFGTRAAALKTLTWLFAPRFAEVELLQHLHGPLQIQFRPNRRDYRASKVLYSEQNSDRTRVICVATGIGDSPRPAESFAPAILGRVTSITITAFLMSVGRMPRSMTMDVCTRIVFEECLPSVLTEYPRGGAWRIPTIRAPNLSNVTLRFAEHEPPPSNDFGVAVQFVRHVVVGYREMKDLAVEVDVPHARDYAKLQTLDLNAREWDEESDYDEESDADE